MKRILLVTLLIFGCAHSPQKPATFKVTGTLSDFNGNRLSGGEVRLIAPGFKDVVVAQTDDKGQFTLEGPRRQYKALYACKDYREKNLEFWYWNIPSDKDHHLDIKIDGLEIYGIQAWKARSGVMAFFRPMSLKRYKALGSPDKTKPAPIAPVLKPEGVKATINGKVVATWGLSRTKEYMGDSKQSMDAYVIHIADVSSETMNRWDQLCLEIRDRQTQEHGQGCAPVFSEQ